MGHEFTGTVVETGSDVKTVKVGDKIVSLFTASWYGHLSCTSQKERPLANILYIAKIVSTANPVSRLDA